MNNAPLGCSRRHLINSQLYVHDCDGCNVEEFGFVAVSTDEESRLGKSCKEFRHFHLSHVCCVDVIRV